MIGKTFGRLTVIKEVDRDKYYNRVWLCTCSCGNETRVITARLNNKTTKSCGCLNVDKIKIRNAALLKDLTGMVFERLTVISKHGRNDKGYITWLCKCECGNEIISIGGNLRKGTTKSCGCLHRDRIRLPDGEASLNTIIRNTKKNAKLRGYVWDLTKEQVRYLTKQNCYYCGVEPKQVLKHPNHNGDYIYNGIDRIDNTKGYTSDNVVPCCGHCNWAKKDLAVEDFIAWVTRIHDHFVLGSDI